MYRLKTLTPFPLLVFFGWREPAPRWVSPGAGAFPLPAAGRRELGSAATGGSRVPPADGGDGRRAPGWRQPPGPLQPHAGWERLAGGRGRRTGGAVSLHLGAGWEWGGPLAVPADPCVVSPCPSPAVCPVKRAYSVSRDEVADQGSKILRKCIIHGGCPT